MKNELLARIVKFLEGRTNHRYCEDEFYACPKNGDYFGRYSNLPIEVRPCDCDTGEAIAILKEIKEEATK